MRVVVDGLRPQVEVVQRPPPFFTFYVRSPSYDGLAGVGRDGSSGLSSVSSLVLLWCRLGSEGPGLLKWKG